MANGRSSDWPSAMATVTGTGRRGPATSSCASRSCARARTSRVFWNPGGWRSPSTSSGALTAVIQEAYIQGISTRSVDDLVQAMGMSGISKSQVSRLCEEIDGRVKTFLERPIEGDWPYLWIDATYVKVRQEEAHRLGRRDHRGGREHRRPARGARPGYRRLGGRDVL